MSGLRFRRSFKIVPGVRLTIGKRGVSSVSVGPRHAHVNASRRGLFGSLGFGHGLSYRKRIK
jgi:hypothetical protein